MAPSVRHQTFTGQGDDVVTLAAPVGFGVLSFECLRCSSNTVVQSPESDLFVNEIGPYSGTRLIGAGLDASTTRLQITATGSWKLTVGGVDTVKAFDGRKAVSGHGDNVLVLRPGPEIVHFTHGGKSNVALTVLALDGRYIDLPINEIGHYDGTVLISADGAAVVVQVTADGAWSLTPR